MTPNWADATVWAESIGGQLPTRPVAALLYANIKSQLQPKWHWTSDTPDADTGDSDHASYAWVCHLVVTAAEVRSAGERGFL